MRFRYCIVLFIVEKFLCDLYDGRRLFSECLFLNCTVLAVVERLAKNGPRWIWVVAVFDQTVLSSHCGEVPGKATLSVRNC